MALYSLHEITLAVESDTPETEAEVVPLLQDLSFVRLSGREQCPSLSLTLRRHSEVLGMPSGAHTVFRTEGLWGGARQ
jgi:hypothetical protein